MLKKSDFAVEENLERISENMRNPEIFDSPGRKLIVSDLDEVCVNITLKWAKKAYVSGLVPRSKIETKKILNRDTYYMCKYLEISTEQALALYDDPNFYDDLEPTRLGTALALAVQLEQVNLILISHNRPATEASKRRFCKKFFPKIPLYLVPQDVPKSNIINELKLNYNLFIDDSPDVLNDIMDNTASQGKEFMCPRYGYNNLFAEKRFKDIANFGIDFNYFTEVL